MVRESASTPPLAARDVVFVRDVDVAQEILRGWACLFELTVFDQPIYGFPDRFERGVLWLVSQQSL